METNVLEKESVASQLENVLSFAMGEELFAMNVTKVIEILEVSKITPVPRAPSYLAGIVDVRGKVLPLIDTRVKLGLTPTEFNVNTCIVVVDIGIESRRINLGVLVDSVLEVLELKQEDLQPSPNIESKDQNDFIIGIFRNGSDFVMLLDIDKIFSVNEVTMFDSIGAHKSNIISEELTSEPEPAPEESLVLESKSDQEKKDVVKKKTVGKEKNKTTRKKTTSSKQKKEPKKKVSKSKPKKKSAKKIQL
ncbi:MAG: hypothetical protein GY816_05205 [Cytophagales bacterium]|nr:hypothetical protein [Cytophagales bacterium]